MLNFLLGTLISLQTATGCLPLSPELEATVTTRRSGEYAEAVILADQAIENSSSEEELGWAYLEKGLSLKLQGYYQEGLEAEEKALSLSQKDSPLYSSALYEKSKCLAGLGRHTDAIETIQKAMMLVKDNKKRYAQMNTRYLSYLFEQGDKKNIHSIRDAFKANLAVQHEIYLELQDSEKNAFRGEMAVTKRQMTHLYLADGEIDQAKILAIDSYCTLKKLLKSSDHPDIGMALFLLGQVFEAAGDVDKANGYYKDALRIYEQKKVNHPDLATLKQKLGYNS